MAAVVAPQRPFSGEIPTERRFPLHLEPSIGTIRALYDAAKQARWDPERLVDWGTFNAARYPATVRDAARLSWSRRAWTEYGGLPETPALIVRFCIEHERESDPKYFLTVRNTEEAWHLDCCHRVAEQLGGFVGSPREPAYQALFNQGLHREALDIAMPLDAYVAAHSALQDGLDLELYRLYRDNARDPIVRAVLDQLVADKTRHAAFGWFYLTERAPAWDDAARTAISAELLRVLNDVELQGFHCAWLVPNDAAAEIVAADEITRDAGLGAATETDEKPVLRRFLADAAGQFARIGVMLALPDHPALRSA
jgi:hypothetical protein